MRMCKTHWEKLRSALETRGLGAFIAKTDEELKAKFDKEPPDFEALLGAHNAILSNALNAAGMELMQKEPDGSERCPLCFLKTCPCGDPACAARYESWIDHAADDALVEAKRLGLVT